MFDITTGKITVVEFMYKGELHKSIRWTTAPEVFDDGKKDTNGLKARYAGKDAEVVSVKHIELSEIQL